MQTIKQYLDYAETTLAAYAASVIPKVNNSLNYVDRGMTGKQADKFQLKWNVLAQSPEQLNGYSAVLLQDRVTGEKVLAIRGTESSQGGADYITDIFDIGVVGSAANMPQYIALEAFYQSLVATGKLGSTEVFNVTGHSLGGFLAQAFKPLADSDGCVDKSVAANDDYCHDAISCARAA
jgi:hypothetical protein